MTRPDTATLFRDYQQQTKKRFGQHFLTDDGILQRIVDFAELDEQEPVLEIGPGCGTLTTHIMSRGNSVTAIELDRDLGEFLETQLVPHGLELIRGDAMKVPLSQPDGTVVISNLPYNVGTHIMFRLLEHGGFARMVLMFQKEVADRICANVGDSAYGALSVNRALHATASRVMVLAPGAFHPPPKVRSAVVVITPHAEPPIADPVTVKRFRELVRRGFNQRRKMLSSSLKGLYEKEAVRDALREAGASEKARPEELAFGQFVEITRRLNP